MKTSTYLNDFSAQSGNRVMNSEQFDRVVKAIIEGKYSWACVLILRFAGYNPAHYIPYRTYKRLIKSNRAEQAQQRTHIDKNMTQSMVEAPRVMSNA